MDNDIILEKYKNDKLQSSQNAIMLSLFLKKNKRILSKIIPSNHLLVTKMAFGIVIIV